MFITRAQTAPKGFNDSTTCRGLGLHREPPLHHEKASIHEFGEESNSITACNQANPSDQDKHLEDMASPQTSRYPRSTQIACGAHRRSVSFGSPHSCQRATPAPALLRSKTAAVPHPFTASSFEREQCLNMRWDLAQNSVEPLSDGDGQSDPGPASSWWGLFSSWPARFVQPFVPRTRLGAPSRVQVPAITE